VWDAVFVVRGADRCKTERSIEVFEVCLRADSNRIRRKTSVQIGERSRQNLAPEAETSERLRRDHSADRAFGMALVRL
jgi:hypothetical protein